MPRIVRELPPLEDSKEQQQQEVRQIEKDIITALNVKTTKDVPKATDVFLNLAPQSFQLGFVSAASARVSSAGATTSVATTLGAAEGIITNIDFDETVTMTSTARISFIGCRFLKAVSMANGARASFVGCSFESEGAVNNAGPAANAGIVGCIKSSPTAHVNVTSIFEV